MSFTETQIRHCKIERKGYIRSIRLVLGTNITPLVDSHFHFLRKDLVVCHNCVFDLENEITSKHYSFPFIKISFCLVSKLISLTCVSQKGRDTL